MHFLNRFGVYDFGWFWSVHHEIVDFGQNCVNSCNEHMAVFLHFLKTINTIDKV